MNQIPKRVVLKGFDQNGQAAAADWLRENGVEVIQMQSLADMVVAGPDSDPELMRRAQVNGAKIVRWEELRAAVASVRFPEMCGAPGSEHGESGEFLPDLDLDPLAETAAVLPIAREGDFLRVLDVRVPLPAVQENGEGSDLIPRADQFEHLCLDQPFLETLRAVALGVLHQIPVALQGETAASKTTAVLYLAHLLGQPVIRLNLNGHTDAGELIGRYVPADAGSLVDWSDLSSQSAWIRPGTRRILQAAADEGRTLSALERLAVLGREQIPVSAWRFQEGYLPRAMRNGWWFLLDELNLAEAQVLERLNCALENPPSLVLSEGGGTVFAAGGDVPVHPAFRMLATLNPAEYAGRAVLSPAFADRWGVWHQSAVPGEREVEQMLRRLVFGEQPRFVLRGRTYRAEAEAPVFGELQAIPTISDLLGRFAVFHYAIFRTAGGGGATPTIGRLNRERYSFSRRVIVHALRYMTLKIRAGEPADEALFPEAIQVFYLSRLRDEADRKAVSHILHAGGLA